MVNEALDPEGKTFPTQVNYIGPDKAQAGARGILDTGGIIPGIDRGLGQVG